jgi:hypothetical protein
MSSWIQLPDGYTFALEAMRTIVADGAAVVLTPADGTPAVRWDATDARYAALVMTALQGIMTSPSGFQTVTPAPIIDSVVLSQEDITLATVTITGCGFYARTVGKLYFEDTSGGQDSNGYYDVCAYVNGQSLTGTYGGAGDGNLSQGGPGVLIYYQDTLGTKSNVINGTNVSGTQVTIP